MDNQDFRATAALNPALWTATGTVTGDLAILVEWLRGLDIERDGAINWTMIQDATDPMATYRVLAAYVAALNVELVAQGFSPPGIDVDLDPLGFVQANGHFLASIAPLVSEPERAVH